MTHVVSLYDYSGEAVRPWAERGYACYCYDIQHESRDPPEEEASPGAVVHYLHADLYDDETWPHLVARHRGRTRFVFGFPVCTDMSNAGAPHFAAKRRADPDFQTRAARRAVQCATFAESVGCDAWMVENPVGALARLWRKPDFIFHPHHYGGHLPEDDAHPLYPDMIPARDAYMKRTCIWCGPGAVRPEVRNVEPEYVWYTRPQTGERIRLSRMWTALGGRSQRTKNLRSATPRGFARAVCAANAVE